MVRLFVPLTCGLLNSCDDSANPQSQIRNATLRSNASLRSTSLQWVAGEARAVIILLSVMLLPLAAGCGTEATFPEPVSLSAADATVSIDLSAGTLRRLRVGKAGVEMASAQPAGFVEVEDLRAHRIYNPRSCPAAIRKRRLSGEPGSLRLAFTQQYERAPFTVAHLIAERPEGIRWEVRLRLKGGQTLNRSVRVSWMLPLPRGWRFWVPNDTQGVRTDGQTPYRAVYGHTHFRSNGTIIPLVGVWSGKAGAAVW
ncbi:hypothetical protein LCGC14_2223220, partial [marine sediment metagenome]